MSFAAKSVLISGKEVLPIIEGGKGIGISNGLTAGAFAKSNAVGTFSGVNPQRFDKDGNLIPIIYHGHTRKERHEELVKMGIEGALYQAQIAYETANGEGAIHMNVLWEMGGAQRILEGVLEKAKGVINGITCGAGMPYKLAEIAERFNIYYYPIVSSMRAFRALWKRSYHKTARLLGAIVYEDPWKAGGHNGLSNSEDPELPGDPYPRVVEIRKFMNEVGLENTPIVMAGGVWHLSEWQDWLDNKEIGPIAFQFGTRPIVTKESPVSNAWKRKLLNLKEGDVFLNRFSPTGFYSSAVKNKFIIELQERNERQVEYRRDTDSEFNTKVEIGARGRAIYVKPQDKVKVENWNKQGFTEALRTPDETIIFVEAKKALEIHKDQVDCMGCLSYCRFSNWQDHDGYTTGKKADPRSFCIQKSLQNIIHDGDIENELMFSGHNAYRFASDPFYQNGFIPSIKELTDQIMKGK
jgi:nitronate monooxygenase